MRSYCIVGCACRNVRRLFACFVKPCGGYESGRCGSRYFQSASFDKELASYSDAVGSSTIIKREMMTYFINYYYTYVQNYDYSYADTFNLILDVLVENAVLVQYSTMYLLMDKATNENSALGYEPNALKEYLEAEENGGEAAKYEYLLGADSKEVLTAEYNLRSTINSAIDSREKEILDEEDSSSGTDTRTAPGGVDTEQEDYFPQKEGADGKIELDYNIYTGYAGYSLDESGAYKKDALDGTSVETRRKAYRRFISGLASSPTTWLTPKLRTCATFATLNISVTNTSPSSNSAL